MGDVRSMAGTSTLKALRTLFTRTDIMGSRRLSLPLIVLVILATLGVCFCVSWVHVAETARRFEHATGLLAQDRFNEATVAFEAVIERDPDAVLAWCGRGLCQLNTGCPGAALESYETALTVEEGNIDALIGKSICLSELGRTTESFKVLDKLLESDPGNRRVQSLISSLKQKM